MIDKITELSIFTSSRDLILLLTYTMSSYSYQGIIEGKDKRGVHSHTLNPIKIEMHEHTIKYWNKFFRL